MSNEVDKEKAIRAIVGSFVEAYASAFSDRHLSEVDDEDGTINMKIHNVFIAALGREIQYYSDLKCSFKKSFERLFRDMALSIEEFVYGYTRHAPLPLFNNNEQDEVALYWNTVCNDQRGYNMVMEELNKKMPIRL